MVDHHLSAFRPRLLLLLMALSGPQIGCAPFPTEEEMRSHDKTYRDTSDSNRIRFVVNGDPGLRKYPEILELKVPMHEKIREGMRRHAADVLLERGWCPNGFSGPHAVSADERARLTSHFFVDCKQ